ncbi:MAG: hypothetical protein PHY80_03040 [Rickettsiales bacterium]|nr:hypothetical protein [Rickettsiales bacterium]
MMLINLVVFYSFLVLVLSFSLCCLNKLRKNKIKIVQNSDLIYKILECYSIDINEFNEFVDLLIADLYKEYKCISRDVLKYDLLNYFILFLNGRNISSSKLNQYRIEYKKKLPLLYIIEKNFILNKNQHNEEIVYYLISNRFSLFLDYSSQKDLGIQFFEWVVPVKDNKVCSFCKSADGKIFSWKEGNNGNFPGQNKCTLNGFCRCKTKPIDLNSKNVKVVKNEDGSYFMQNI